MSIPVPYANNERMAIKLTPLQWLEVAALVGVIVLATPALARRFGPVNVPEASVHSFALSDSLTATILAQPLWGGMRGDGEAELHPEARAVRLGAALAALELRRQHGDSASGASLDSALAGANERAVRLGTWLETARFAAAARDSAYFAGSAARAVARSAITIDGRADTEYAARQFQQVISVRPHDWAAIATSVEELLRRLGSR